MFELACWFYGVGPEPTLCAAMLRKRSDTTQLTRPTGLKWNHKTPHRPTGSCASGAPG
jgi:hypothetical protein